MLARIAKESYSIVGVVLGIAATVMSILYLLLSWLPAYLSPQQCREYPGLLTVVIYSVGIPLTITLIAGSLITVVEYFSELRVKKRRALFDAMNYEEQISYLSQKKPKKINWDKVGFFIMVIIILAAMTTTALSNYYCW